MRTLILGGTGFLGRHAAEACIARGHDVTLFHRGLSNARAFPGATHIVGNRETEIDKLTGKTWDAVIDTSGYEVRTVRDSARAVAGSRAHYVFVSSISVYAELTHTHESDAVHELANADTTALSLPAYGGLKAACERAIETELPGRVTQVRAGLILGPHDYDERFPYWLRRIARGGETLAPGNPDAPVQFIDARDLAVWMVKCAEDRINGTFNTTGPGESMTMRSLLEMIRDVTGSNATFTWVPDEILVAHEVRPYSEMPFWLPASEGYVPIDASRAIENGLTYRSAIVTVRDTWEWLKTGWEAAASVRANRKIRVPGGMTDERELAIIRARAPAGA